MVLVIVLSTVVTPLRASQNYELAEAIATVVVLNDQGEPLRQGLGVSVGKGKILTAASLLGDHPAVIRTNSGAMHLVQQVIHRDGLQDLALVKVKAENLADVPVASSKKVSPPQKLLVGQRVNNRAILRGVEAVSMYPFSPRLLFLKLTPSGTKNEIGAPLFTEEGELVGMLHAPTIDLPKAKGHQFFLLLQSKRLPLSVHAPEVARSSAHRPADQELEPYHHLWQGVAASLWQDWRGAHQEFSVALACTEKLPEAYCGRGIAYYHLGDIKNSLDDLLKAIHGAPDYALAFLWAGKAWECQGNRENARLAFRQATELAPDLSEAWFCLGTLAYREGDLIRGQEYLEKAKDDFDQASVRWWYLGQIARARNQLEKAAAAFQRAAELNPNFSQAYLEGGKVLLELGRPQEAIEFLNKSTELDPQGSAARYHLALANLMAWNPAAAWEQYFILQKTDPERAVSLASMLERGP